MTQNMFFIDYPQKMEITMPLRVSVFICINAALFSFTDDFRIFCGDLGNEVNDDILARAFSRYPSFLKAKVGCFLPWLPPVFLPVKTLMAVYSLSVWSLPYPSLQSHSKSKYNTHL